MTGVRDYDAAGRDFRSRRDHTKSAQLGFPCMQQVSFVPTREGLVTNAFYATQQMFDKAYGNYLGLAQLWAPSWPSIEHEAGPAQRLCRRRQARRNTKDGCGT